jgi:DNA-binding NtrC family response regulator
MMIQTQTGMEAHPTLLAKARILVVDDETDISSAVARLLELEGYLVRIAHSGDEAIRLLQHTPYDLMLLDMNMPGLSGLDVLQWIKQRQLNLAVIVLTGHKEFKAAVTAPTATPVAGFLVKPVSHQEIITAVTRALR